MFTHAHTLSLFLSPTYRCTYTHAYVELRADTAARFFKVHGLIFHNNQACGGFLHLYHAQRQIVVRGVERARATGVVSLQFGLFLDEYVMLLLGTTKGLVAI